VLVVRAMAEPASLRTAKGYKRVVVTGLGVVSPLGHDVDTFYDNLLEGTPPPHHPRAKQPSVRIVSTRTGSLDELASETIHGGES
jgi:3-oxoacyl-(acyl-carrier-protein) synthase